MPSENHNHLLIVALGSRAKEIARDFRERESSCSFTVVNVSDDFTVGTPGGDRGDLPHGPSVFRELSDAVTQITASFDFALFNPRFAPPVLNMVIASDAGDCKEAETLAICTMIREIVGKQFRHFYPVGDQQNANLFLYPLFFATNLQTAIEGTERRSRFLLVLGLLQQWFAEYVPHIFLIDGLNGERCLSNADIDRGVYSLFAMLAEQECRLHPGVREIFDFPRLNTSFLYTRDTMAPWGYGAIADPDTLRGILRVSLDRVTFLSVARSDFPTEEIQTCFSRLLALEVSRRFTEPSGQDRKEVLELTGNGEIAFAWKTAEKADAEQKDILGALPKLDDYRHSGPEKTCFQKLMPEYVHACDSKANSDDYEHFYGTAWREYPDTIFRDNLPQSYYNAFADRVDGIDRYIRGVLLENESRCETFFVNAMRATGGRGAIAVITMVLERRMAALSDEVASAQNRFTLRNLPHSPLFDDFRRKALQFRGICHSAFAGMSIFTMTCIMGILVGLMTAPLLYYWGRVVDPMNVTLIQRICSWPFVPLLLSLVLCQLLFWTMAGTVAFYRGTLFRQFLKGTGKRKGLLQEAAAQLVTSVHEYWLKRIHLSAEASLLRAKGRLLGRMRHWFKLFSRIYETALREKQSLDTWIAEYGLTDDGARSGTGTRYIGGRYLGDSLVKAEKIPELYRTLNNCGGTENLAAAMAADVIDFAGESGCVSSIVTRVDENIIQYYPSLRNDAIFRSAAAEEEILNQLRLWLKSLALRLEASRIILGYASFEEDMDIAPSDIIIFASESIHDLIRSCLPDQGTGFRVAAVPVPRPYIIAVRALSSISVQTVGKFLQVDDKRIETMMQQIKEFKNTEVLTEMDEDDPWMLFRNRKEAVIQSGESRVSHGA